MNSNSNQDASPSYNANSNGNTDYNSNPNSNSDSDGNSNSNNDGNLNYNSDSNQDVNSDYNAEKKIDRNHRYHDLDQMDAVVRRSNYNYDNNDKNKYNNYNYNDFINNINNNNNYEHNIEHNTEYNVNSNNNFNLQYLTNEVEISGPAGPAADQFDRCLKALRPLLEKDHGHLCMLVYDGECSIDGAYQPILPDDGRFIGTSSYVLPWEILMLPDTANLELYRSRAENVCSLSFEDVLQYYEMKGLVDSDSKLAEMLPYFCFLSSYAYVLLVGTYIFDILFLSSCSCLFYFIFHFFIFTPSQPNRIKLFFKSNLILFVI